MTDRWTDRRTDKQTDTHTCTHRPSTVTLAAHARRGLTMPVIYMYTGIHVLLCHTQMRYIHTCKSSGHASTQFTLPRFAELPHMAQLVENWSRE